VNVSIIREFFLEGFLRKSFSQFWTHKKIPMKKIYALIFLLAAATQLHAQCSDLFISEYLEGLSFNKALEVYNPTSGSINMDGYRLETYSNGMDTPTFVFNLHGMLASNDVYVITLPQADSTLAQLGDTTSLVCNYNGNDAVALINVPLLDTIDIIGIIGDLPGTSWPVDTGSTKDHDLVRMASVQQGTTDWNLGATQWMVYGATDFSHLGSHTMTPCNNISPSLFFPSSNMSVSESDGSFSVDVNITNPNATATSVDVSAIDITANNNLDYTFPLTQTITFPANSSSPINLSGTIIDDIITETDEVFELQLTNPTNNAILTGDVIKITILDNDGLNVSSPSLLTAVKIFPTISNGLFTVKRKQLHR